MQSLFIFSINLSGCGIKPGPLAKAPSGVWSVTSAESPPTCGELLARAIGLVKTPLRFLDLSVNDIGSVSKQINRDQINVDAYVFCLNVLIFSPVTLFCLMQYA